MNIRKPWNTDSVAFTWSTPLSLVRMQKLKKKINEQQQEVQQALIWWLQNVDGLKSTRTVFGRQTAQNDTHQNCKYQKRDFPLSPFPYSGEIIWLWEYCCVGARKSSRTPPLCSSVFTDMPACWLPVKRWNPCRGFWAYQEDMPLEGQMFWGLSGLPPKLLPSFHCIFALAL